jgi:hypothetical protein
MRGHTGGVIRPDKGSGNPEVDQAATNAGRLGDRPLIVLTAGKCWKPDDPVAAKEIAAFHEVSGFTNFSQTSLTSLMMVNSLSLKAVITLCQNKRHRL